MTQNINIWLINEKVLVWTIYYLFIKYIHIFIKYSNDMCDVYKNIDENKPDKEIRY